MADLAFQFWERVDRLRGNKTLSELALVMDIKEQSLRAMRSQCRYPKGPAIQALASFLDSTPEYLVSGVESDNEKVIKHDSVIDFVKTNEKIHDIVQAMMDNPDIIPHIAALVELKK